MDSVNGFYYQVNDVLANLLVLHSRKNETPLMFIRNYVCSLKLMSSTGFKIFNVFHEAQVTKTRVGTPKCFIHSNQLGEENKATNGVMIGNRCVFTTFLENLCLSTRNENPMSPQK